MKILVAGGGIGGLVAAIALSQRGLEVEVLEQQAEPREVGAGIAIAPNGARVLTSLGIDNSIAPVLHSPAGVRLRSGRSGRLIVDRRLDSEEARPGARSYNLHRGDLRQALLAAALACPNVAIRLGQRVVSISEEPKRIRVETHAGSSASGDALIGADGIHSVVRRTVAGPDAPQFAGEVVWRGLVKRDRVPADASAEFATVWSGTDRHFLHYLVRGGELLNIGGFVESEEWRNESWTEPGRKADFARLFANFHPAVRKIIDGTDECFVQAIHQRAPLAAWWKGRAVLVGDACHAMPPHMGQGAGMAIEDAVVLARSMAEHRSDLATAFASYQAKRHARVTRLVAQVREMGQLWNFGNPIRGAILHSFLWVMSRVRTSEPWAWVHDYDALSC